MPIPGAPSPSVSPAPANIGPVATPQGNPGNTQAAMTKVKNALQMLQSALPDIPMGNQLHTDVINVVKSLSKHLSESNDNKGLELQQLIQMAKSSAQQAPNAALARMFPNPQNQPPAMPAAGAAA